MSTRVTHRGDQHLPARATRAQRRAAERASSHNHAHNRAHRRNVPSGTSVLVGVALILIVFAALTYAVVGARVHSSASAAPALNDPAALNPASALIPVGSKAPDFTLADIHGKPFHLAAQRGHPVMLEFFAVWCPRCQAEAPITARLMKEFAPRGVRFWSVLANPYGRNFEESAGKDLRLVNRDDLSWFARTYQAAYPQLVDPQFQVVNRYGVDGYPGLYIVDSNGKVTFAAKGEHSYAALKQEIERALPGRQG